MELERQLTTLQGALHSRDTIGMAKGILLAREYCTPDEAFEILKNVSQRTNRKLAELAELAAEMVLVNRQEKVVSAGTPAATM